MEIRSIYSSGDHAKPFYTYHLSGAWMIAHRWSDSTDNGAQVRVEMADGLYCPIVWGRPY